MTDLIKGTILLFNHLDELKGSDRRAVIETLNESMPELFGSLSELVIGSVDKEWVKENLLDVVVSEEGSILVKEGLDLCYHETSGTCKRGGIELACRNIENYCDESFLCNACFGELHSEDFLTCVDVEEYQGAMVNRVTNCGFVCPHCGFREEW